MPIELVHYQEFSRIDWAFNRDKQEITPYIEERVKHILLDLNRVLSQKECIWLDSLILKTDRTFRS